MKPLLNTLFVTTQGAWLAQDGETVAVRLEKETLLRVPVHTLSGIVCFGQVSASAFVMGMCAERGVALSFLTEHGRFLAKVQGPVSGNVLLRRKQYRLTDEEAGAASVARAVVLAKVANCRTVLLRAARERGESDGVAALVGAALRLKRILDEVAVAATVDEIRGHEGDAARAYFDVFDHLILGDKEQFFFRGRSRRPPLDNMNALLSFLYTLLTHDTVGALEAVGLDPAVGYLHRERPGRPSLALDLVEELRPVLADRLALTLINRQQISASGFRKLESGAVTMDQETRKQVLVAWQKRKQEEIIHPFLEERMPMGLVPHIQAMLLSRYLRGDLDGYPCFFWK
ncbi:MAG TPA: type I-C CRISPR-associated endonuclease Cas1c [Bryobacteraceae bacterium]|jgi:CRISPR-associated protein Cas1|nr:type I-C CRISPR-associated endonuclease Cas1c [Bryobacteraceae bacterium]